MHSNTHDAVDTVTRFSENNQKDFVGPLICGWQQARPMLGHRVSGIVTLEADKQVIAAGIGIDGKHMPAENMNAGVRCSKDNALCLAQYSIISLAGVPAGRHAIRCLWRSTERQRSDRGRNVRGSAASSASGQSKAQINITLFQL